jgi:hypothetical protein
MSPTSKMQAGQGQKEGQMHRNASRRNGSKFLLREPSYS